MAIRDIVKALSGKKKEKEQALVPENKQDETKAFLTGEDFPVIRASELDMSRYHKVPLTGLAALGAAFSTLPEAARTITTSTVKDIVTNEQLYTAVNPKNAVGWMVDRGRAFRGTLQAWTEAAALRAVCTLSRLSLWVSRQ